MAYTIGQFNDSFTPVIDGVATVVKNYAFWLNKKYAKCCVVTPSCPGYKDDEEFDVLRYPSVPLPKRKFYRLGLPLADYDKYKKITKIDFNLIHVHCPFSSGRLGYNIAKKKKVPLIATFHSKFYDDFKQAFKNDKLALAATKKVVNFFEKADFVWTVNKSTAETLKEYGYKGSIDIIYNGIDFKAPENTGLLINEAKDKLHIKNDGFVFLYVGQHIWQKNIRMLIEALSMVKKKNVSFTMLMVGDGYAFDKIKSLAYELGLKGNIIFTGIISDRNLLKSIYACADLFLFPSIYDTASIVSREAAAFGCPSVLIKNSNAAEGISDNVNGFLSENSSEKLAEKICDICSDKGNMKKTGQNACKTLGIHWEAIIDEAYQKYCDILKYWNKKNNIR